MNKFNIGDRVKCIDISQIKRINDGEFAKDIPYDKDQIFGVNFICKHMTEDRKTDFSYFCSIPGFRASFGEVIVNEQNLIKIPNE